jgi:competence protein ComEC
MRAGALALFWLGAGACLERNAHSRFLSSPLIASSEIAARLERRLPVPVRGWIADDPARLRDRIIFPLRVEQAWWGGRWRGAPGTIRVALRLPGAGSPSALGFGDRVELPLRLRPVRNFRNPGSFDYERYLEGEGIHRLGTLKSLRLVERLPGSGGRWVSPIHRLRARLLRRLGQAFPDEGHEESRLFLEAILLGQRRGSEGEFESLFRQTGVYHILSISGLHFALLMGGLGWAIRRLPGGRCISPAVLVGAGALYVALSGGEDPILRSSLAILFASWGKRCGRRVGAVDAQSHAGIVLLALHPLHLFDPGFQLSFVATLGVLAGGRFAPPWRERISRIRAAVAASTAAWIASAPIVAAAFFQVSPIALALNLAAAPFLSGSLFLGAGLLVLPRQVLAAPCEMLLDTFSALCRMSLAIPGAFRRVPAPSPLLLILFAGSAIAALLPAGAAGRIRDRPAAFVAALLLAAMLFPPGPAIAHRPLECVALDVGQGDALLVRLPQGKDILVDAGGFTGTDFDVGDKIVVPALLTLGVRSLDLLILTHAHQDHGGGIPAVIAAFSPREIWIGRRPPHSRLLDRIADDAAARRIPVLFPTRGTLKCLGESCLEVLHPPRGFRPDAEVSNEDSLVVRLFNPEASLLLTGDIEREGESLLLASPPPLASDLLKVAHHGSNSSTSEDFLNAVRPSAAVISAGEGNLWDHPSPEVVARLRRHGIRLFRTDRDGAILFTFEAGAWKASRTGE